MRHSITMSEEQTMRPFNSNVRYSQIIICHIVKTTFVFPWMFRIQTSLTFITWGGAIDNKLTLVKIISTEQPTSQYLN